MVQSWLNGIPLRYVLDELELVGQGQDVHVRCDIQVEYVEFIPFAEVIGDVNETGGAGLWDSVVDHDQVIVCVQVGSG